MPESYSLAWREYRKREFLAVSAMVALVDDWRLLAGPEHWLTLCSALDIRIRVRIPARDLAMPKMRQGLWSLFGPLSPLRSTIMVARRIGLKFPATIGK